MLPNLIIMFLVSFLVECSAAGYTIALTRGRVNLAIILSVLNDVLGWLVVLYVVYNDLGLLPAAIVGNALGTALTMKIARRI